MSNRWQANKIGLVNFWYYDEQEFPFAKGRMLLRGSNGSGKSVTMQSVVPLLLDGNVNPERLDPFGTRDRKMSNYLWKKRMDEMSEPDIYIWNSIKVRMKDILPLGWDFAQEEENLLINGILRLTMVVVSGRIFSYIKKREKRLPYRKRNWRIGWRTVDGYLTARWIIWLM